jgi:YbbR domain-containing protein
MPVSTDNIFSNDARRFSLRRFFRRVFLEDWLIKAIALFITVTLWLGVTGLREPKTTRLRSVPLNLRVSNDIEVTNSPVQEVDLVITGDKHKIELLNERDLVVSLDLTDVPVGERSVQMSAENVNIELPSGVRLEEIQPSKIAVKLEAVEEREITVQAVTEGAVAEGLEIYNKTVSPAKVRVRGPESFVKSLDSVSTEKINLESRQENFIVRQVALNVVNPKVTVLDAAVEVSFKIGEKRTEKTFTVPFKTGAGNKSATVVLYGGRSILEALKSENLNVVISEDDSPNLILPAEVSGQVEIRKLKIN